MSQHLLFIKDLSISLIDNNGRRIIVDSINLQVKHRNIVALVGASGSGKTTVGLAVMRLLPSAMRVNKGAVFFDGRNLMEYSIDHMRILRGSQIGMVFQEPLNAFNPVFRIGFQIEEVLLFHTNLNRRQRKARVLELLQLVGLPDPKRAASAYPHQLSGGMRQRAMIAQAIAGNPKLIIADEPTSSLDVTLQARIIELFKMLREKLGIAILLITHDIAMVSHMADDVVVMHAGKVVETGSMKQILTSPREEYTIELLDACV